MKVQAETTQPVEVEQTLEEICTNGIAHLKRNSAALAGALLDVEPYIESAGERLYLSDMLMIKPSQDHEDFMAALERGDHLNRSILPL
jgi:hypothetical protein